MLQFLWDVGDWVVDNIFKPAFGKYWCEIVFLILLTLFVIIFVLMLVYTSKYKKIKKLYRRKCLDNDTLTAKVSAKDKLLEEKQEECVRIKANLIECNDLNADLTNKLAKNEKLAAKLKADNEKISSEYSIEVEKVASLQKDKEDAEKLIKDLQKTAEKETKKTTTVSKKATTGTRKKKTILVE